MIEQLLDRITKACVKPSGDFSICANTDLVPVDGMDYNKVMPPTYAGDKGPEYHFETRYKDGKKVEVVILDSIASCANRIEIAVLNAWREKEFPLPILPVVEVDINPTHKEEYSVLELPHRIFSTHFKMSVTPDGKDFMDSTWGRKLYNSRNDIVMKEVFKLNPFSILLGSWRSQVKDVQVNQARAYRKARCLIMEIIGGSNQEVIRTKKSGGMLVPIEIPPGDEKLGFSKKPSELGLGSTPPSLSYGGVSVEWICERMHIAIQALFDYCTGDKNHDIPARAMLVCMGLYAHALRRENYFLRSNCYLRTKDMINNYKWNGEEEFTLIAGDAKKLYVASAKRVPDLEIGFDKLVLKANKSLTNGLKAGFIPKLKGKKSEE
jgi:CRISPR-associated protein Csb1